MKKFFFPQALLLLAMTLSLVFTACQDESDLQSVTNGSSELETRSNPNNRVFPPTADPYGKSMAEWTADWWKHVYASTLATFPILDATGEFTDLNQTGPVYFLFGTFGATVERSATIPHGKAVLFPLLNYANTYPCPDPNFEPGPGQSLEDFLSEGASGIIDLGTGLSVTLDGVELENEEAYRFNSGLYDFTGNSELSALDPCVTGTVQQAVSDGYWMMLKPLSYGEHVLNFTGAIPDWGFYVDVTYTITVE